MLCDCIYENEETNLTMEFWSKICGYFSLYLYFIADKALIKNEKKKLEGLFNVIIKDTFL